MAEDRTPEPDTALLGADPGLCGECVHAKVSATRRGTAYLRCLRAAWDERLVRYPRLPVGTCPGFERSTGRQAPEPETADGAEQPAERMGT